MIPHHQVVSTILIDLNYYTFYNPVHEHNHTVVFPDKFINTKCIVRPSDLAPLLDTFMTELGCILVHDSKKKERKEKCFIIHYNRPC